ncbi:MAG: hypothetical protein PVH99_20415 [Desulfobacteraceae bacterium]|jgi:hypothetical protein
MPIVRDIPLNLSTREVLRRVGIKAGSIRRPKTEALIGKLLDRIANDDLLEPIIAYKIYPILELDEHKIRVQGDTVLEGSLLPMVLAEAKELAAVISTIGPMLEREVTKCFGRKTRLEGLLLDGIGSVAMDSLCQHVCRLMSRVASEKGYRASSPVNPGMPGFPMSEQWRLFDLASGGEINVSLTSSGMMVPRKSVSMVIGIGPHMKTWTQAETCARCTLSKTCAYRYHGDPEPPQEEKWERSDGAYN